MEYLKDHQIKYKISDKYFKIEFETERQPDKVKEEDEEELKTEGPSAVERV